MKKKFLVGVAGPFEQYFRIFQMEGMYFGLIQLFKLLYILLPSGRTLEIATCGCYIFIVYCVFLYDLCFSLFLSFISMNLCLSVGPWHSFQRIGSLVFSTFLCEVRVEEYINKAKFNVCFTKNEQNGPKMTPK